MSESLRRHGLQPTRLLCPWSSPGKNTGVGCHFLLQCYVSVQFSHSVVSDSLRPHELQHAGLPCPYQLPELAQTPVHCISDAIQPSHPLSSPSPPAFNVSQHQGLFQCLFFTSGGQSIGVSASASVLPMNTQD